MSYQFDTKCIHAEGDAFTKDQTGCISFPIYQSATFAHPEVGQSTGYDYSRLQNPTREQVEKVVAGLESAADAIGFSTGMAAIGACMQLFKTGDHIICSEDLYGGSIRMFRLLQQQTGIIFDFVDTGDLSAIIEKIQESTKAIFIETPSNPMMNVTDIRATADLAKEHNLLLIVDNTFLTPYFQNPIELGADIIIHSGTKFLGGHNDTLAGFLAIASPEIAERLRYIAKTVGACLAPFDSWLILRGIKTLALRMERHEKNAREIAEWLTNQKKVKAVHYAGLPDHPGHEINKKQSKGFGSIISFSVDSKETVCDILKKINLVQYAESLGGVESLMTYPITQTHADVPAEENERKGITDKLLRISVGVEDVKDIILDLENALGE